MSWTQDRINLLVKLWSSGKSASMIAKELGDITRNAVIGKVYRLGLSNRDTVVKSSGSKEKVKTKNTQARKAKRTRPSTPDHKKISVNTHTVKPRRPNSSIVCELNRKTPHAITSILDLNDRTCKWPIGHPDEEGFHFCGCPTHGEGPYCAYHMSIAHAQQQQPIKEDNRLIQIVKNEIESNRTLQHRSSRHTKDEGSPHSSAHMSS